MPKLLAEFVASADAGTLDTECMESAFVMPFFLDFSGPMP
jgi:hypothetical protein